MAVDASFHDRLSRIEASNGRPPTKAKTEAKKTAPKEDRQKSARSPLVTFFMLLPLTIIIPAIIGVGYVIIASP